MSSSHIDNLKTVRQSLVVRRRDLASRGAMSPADGGRSATQIKSIQDELAALDVAIAEEVAAQSATPAAAA
jgi:hypothetical protein